MSRSTLRLVLPVLGAAALVLGPAAAAEAHVRVIPEKTAAGGFSKLTFRVPTESDTASTTKLAVTLPTGTPLVYVSAQPVPGWSVKITRAKLPEPIDLEGTEITEAPSVVTWTADDRDDAVAPGEFQEFSLSAGPLPAAASELAFPAAQTYSDGKVVKWDQPAPAGGEEPEYPVPAFAVTAAEPDGGAAAATASTTTAAASEVSDGTARWLGAGGLAVGVLGLAAAGLALTRRRA